MTTKFCRKCHQIKPVAEFTQNRHNKDGLGSYCQPCNKRVHREWLKKHPTYDRDRMRRKRALKRLSESMSVRDYLQNQEKLLQDLESERRYIPGFSIRKGY